MNAVDIGKSPKCEDLKRRAAQAVSSCRRRSHPRERLDNLWLAHYSAQLSMSGWEHGYGHGSGSRALTRGSAFQAGSAGAKPGAVARVAASHAEYLRGYHGDCNSSSAGCACRRRPRRPHPGHRLTAQPRAENALEPLVLPSNRTITPLPLDPGRELNG